MINFMQKTFTFQHTTVAYEDVCEGFGADLPEGIGADLPEDIGADAPEGIGADARRRKPVVVFIHGFAEEGTVWKHQVAALREKYRLIVPDLPGSGLSPLLKASSEAGKGSSPGGPSSIETFAELIHALLRHEKIDHCCMIGHSMGGYITLAFAGRYPEYLSGFGLFHSTAFEDSAEKQQTRRKSITFIQENGVRPFLKQSTPNLFADRFKQTQPGEVEALLQRGERFSREALTGYYEAMLNRPDKREVIEKSPVPVLMIIGKQDNAVPLKESLQLISLSEMTFVYIMDQVAHMGMWEAIPESNEALMEYLRFTFREY
jgi:pimeloyl-ACP methyl ester carboxylesterase